MEVFETSLEGVRVLQPARHFDERGFFSPVFSQETLVQFGIHQNWVQDNHSQSARAGVVRGLHFQKPPAAQAKLVRVIKGAIFDVAVDIRIGSPTFGQHVGMELSAENWKQLYIPEGLAHGFCTLEPDTEVLYKVSSRYEPNFEGGLRWDDSSLNIQWPVDRSSILVSKRDEVWPALEAFVSPFAI